MNTRDAKGNYIPWTGRSTKPERTFGSRFSVQHTSASGWFVFDNLTDRVVKDGLGSLERGKELARKLAQEHSQ